MRGLSALRDWLVLAVPSQRKTHQLFPVNLGAADELKLAGEEPPRFRMENRFDLFPAGIGWLQRKRLLEAVVLAVEIGPEIGDRAVRTVIHI